MKNNFRPYNIPYDHIDDLVNKLKVKTYNKEFSLTLYPSWILSKTSHGEYTVQDINADSLRIFLIGDISRLFIMLNKGLTIIIPEEFEIEIENHRGLSSSINFNF